MKGIPYEYLMRDEIKQLNDNNAIILNLDVSTGAGTHWVYYQYIPVHKFIIYSDSFGRPPPQELMNVAGKIPVYYTNEQFQAKQSTACGYFAVAIAKMIYKYMNTVDIITPLDQYLKEALKIYSTTNLKQNDLIAYEASGAI